MAHLLVLSNLGQQSVGLARKENVFICGGSRRPCGPWTGKACSFGWALHRPHHSYGTPTRSYERGLRDWLHGARRALVLVLLQLRNGARVTTASLPRLSCPASFRERLIIDDSCDGAIYVRANRAMS
jgi:hypothetical protein